MSRYIILYIYMWRRTSWPYTRRTWSWSARSIIRSSYGMFLMLLSRKNLYHISVGVLAVTNNAKFPSRIPKRGFEPWSSGYDIMCHIGGWRRPDKMTPKTVGSVGLSLCYTSSYVIFQSQFNAWISTGILFRWVNCTPIRTTYVHITTPHFRIPKTLLSHTFKRNLFELNEFVR